MEAAPQNGMKRVAFLFLFTLSALFWVLALSAQAQTAQDILTVEKKAYSQSQLTVSCRPIPILKRLLLNTQMILSSMDT